MEVFRTIHGSHLYGLAHEGSDDDLYVVTDSVRRKARQSVVEKNDVLQIGLDLFLERAATGSHQTLEAMFSPYKEWTAWGWMYRPMIESYRVTGADVFAKYERTIIKFCYGDFKRRRHAVRLWFNLADLRRDGRFNPVLHPIDIGHANKIAVLEGDDLVRTLGYNPRNKED